MNERDRYWDTMSQIRRQALYLDRCQAHIEKIDRRIDMGSALVSSGGVGAWLVHHEYALAGALAVVLTNIFQVIKQYLPYKRQIRPVATLGRELHRIALDAETEWHDVDGGMFEPRDIHHRMISLEKRVNDAESRTFPNSSLGENKKFIQMANDDNEDYFVKRYHKRVEE
jgi:hypothetical protein